MKQLLVLSGKGGTGKTTIASAFIKLSDAKAYADCDVDAPNLHLVMSRSIEPKRTNYFGLPKAEINPELCVWCDLCRQNCRFDAIDVTDQYNIDFYACEGCGVCQTVCPSGAITLKPTVAGELQLYLDDSVFSTAQLKMGSGTSGMLVTEVKKQLKDSVGDVGIAIIDGSPGIGCPVIASVSGVDMVLIVAEPSVSGISDMERVIITAIRFQTKIAVCINKFDLNTEKTREIENYCNEFKIPMVGKIPYDPMVVKAVNDGKCITEVDCAAGRASIDVFDETIRVFYNHNDESRR
ncbi:MAG: ATP-binding protein [Eubacteriales bacterium]|nr:ATP-binding protein [Eubacteriales bacterium]